MKKRGFTGLLAFISLSTFAQSNSTQDFKPYSEKVPGTQFEINMVPIQGGMFAMGSSDADKNKKPDETPQRNVSIEPFWMGTYEITHDIFDAFFRDQATSVGSEVDAVTRPTPQYIDLSWGMGKTGGFPVNSMSQDAALMFCRWLYQKTGSFYRLPSEAEWEYACRAGATTIYPFGDDPKELGKYAWFKGNSKSKYQKVGQKQPNAWGLYDMLGNVSEWTLDQYDEKYFDKIGDNAVEPVIPPGSRYPRSVRGGSYLDGAENLRSASRQHSETSWNKRDPQIPRSRWWLTDAMFVGFRVIRPLKQPAAEEANAFYDKYLKK